MRLMKAVVTTINTLHINMSLYNRHGTLKHLEGHQKKPMKYSSYEPAGHMKKFTHECAIYTLCIWKKA